MAAVSRAVRRRAHAAIAVLTAVGVALAWLGGAIPQVAAFSCWALACDVLIIAVTIPGSRPAEPPSDDESDERPCRCGDRPCCGGPVETVATPTTTPTNGTS